MEKLERKLFPNDSLYQRPHRRAAIFFGILGLVILIYGMAEILIKLNHRIGGQEPEYQKMLRR